MHKRLLTLSLEHWGVSALPAAPAIDALVEAESITTLAAQGASWLADASAALSDSADGATAPGGSAIAVGAAGATAPQLAAIAAPFMDMGDRHVQRTAAALASVAATVAQAVDTLLADGTVDADDMEQEEGDGGAKYLVYPSDWTTCWPFNRHWWRLMTLGMLSWLLDIQWWWTRRQHNRCLPSSKLP